jgi:hypothetical protein
MNLKPGEVAAGAAQPNSSLAPAPAPVNKVLAKDPFEAWANSQGGGPKPGLEDLNPFPPKSAPAPTAPKFQTPQPNPPIVSPAPAPAATKPSAGNISSSPLNFKGKGLEDDPFGIFGSSASPAPKTVPLPSTPSADQVMDDQAISTPSAPIGHSLGHTASPFPASRKPDGLPPISELGFVSPKPDPNMEAPSPLAPKMPTPAPPAGPPKLKLDPMGKPGVAPATVPDSREFSAPSLSVPSGFGEVLVSDPLPQTTQPGGKHRPTGLLMIAKQWGRFYLQKWMGMLEPLSKKLHLPVGVLAGLVLVVLVGAVSGGIALLPAPDIRLVSSVPPVHLVEMSTNQISEMDITAYSDFQSQLQNMGFTDLIEFNLPQLPNTNFMHVGMKSDVGTYCEIIKFPGSIAPKVSFVTVFTNGTWFSTNGWSGTDQNKAWQISEFFPDSAPDQLYVKHVQRVQQLSSDNGWQVQAMSVNRYIAALSDEIRTYVVQNKIPAYKADFELWH